LILIVDAAFTVEAPASMQDRPIKAADKAQASSRSGALGIKTVNPILACYA
jgi:hypothetical protein